MRVFKRGDVYYVEFARADRQSLRAPDKKLAESIFGKLQKETLMGRLACLDPGVASPSGLRMAPP